ncbi:heme-binding protein [Erythrobacter sp. Alg231-14]|uniref:heme-binding protein n=1 Tax=Erythrobacter sp. Alg231-14 TaxID=1922225 RepID=UPI000D55CA35
MGIGKWMVAGIGLAAIGSVLANGQNRSGSERDGEEPAYDVVLSEDAFELRKYAPMIVAEVTHTGSRRRASGASFRRLAAYIFAQDRPAGGERIAMTAPVIQERVDQEIVDQDQAIAMTAPVIQQETSDDQWRMRFVMPARFTMETLPKPPSDITLTQVPTRQVATVRFSGVARNNDWAVMEAMLIDWVAAQDLIAVGGIEYASYDSPMVPGRFRRNEVLIEVTPE